MQTEESPLLKCRVLADVLSRVIAEIHIMRALIFENEAPKISEENHKVSKYSLVHPEIINLIQTFH